MVALQVGAVQSAKLRLEHQTDTLCTTRHIPRLLPSRKHDLVCVTLHRRNGRYVSITVRLRSMGRYVHQSLHHQQLLKTFPGKFVDPAAGFALGWSYWFSYCITIANELQAANTIISFWTTAVPIAAWITIWWVVIILVNVGAVTIFGEIEVVASTIKFGWIFVVIISMIVMSAGKKQRFQLQVPPYSLLQVVRAMDPSASDTGTRHHSPTASRASSASCQHVFSPCLDLRTLD